MVNDDRLTSMVTRAHQEGLIDAHLSHALIEQIAQLHAERDRLRNQAGQMRLRYETAVRQALDAHRRAFCDPPSTGGPSVCKRLGIDVDKLPTWQIHSQVCAAIDRLVSNQSWTSQPCTCQPCTCQACSCQCCTCEPCTCEACNCPPCRCPERTQTGPAPHRDDVAHHDHVDQSPPAKDPALV